MFKLDSRLEADSFFVKDLKLCQLRLVNDANYPWVMLIPRLNNLRDMIDLQQENQLLLMQEISHVTGVLKAITKAQKMNVAALGNVVSQLHVHIIARFSHDVAWPAPVWSKHPAKPYEGDNFLKTLSEAV